MFILIAFLAFLCAVNPIKAEDGYKMHALHEKQKVKGNIMSAHIEQDPNFVKSRDGLDLAYYSFLPESPTAVFLFYHGSGLYGNSLYQNFAQQLSKDFNIGCFLFDIRGHGNSQGISGDVTSANQVWDDITTAINYIKEIHPNIPLFVGGHSSGAGLVLNYSDYNGCESVDGYIFVAPYFGINSGFNNEAIDPVNSFIKDVKVWKFILNALSFGYFFGHSPAVFFNFPKELGASLEKLVGSYSVTLMNALSPYDPQKLFAQLDKPVGLFAGENDVQCIPNKVIDYLNLLPSDVKEKSKASIIPDVDHFGTVSASAQYLGSFIVDFIKNKRA